jgi:hypothetical protein
VRCGVRVWVQLRPFDNRRLKNSIIILDNAIIHTSRKFIRMLERVGCLVLFLSPYSPDYNPIELCFAQLKRYLRRHRRQARQNLRFTVSAGLRNTVTAANMAAYARKCHYRVAPTANNAHRNRAVARAVVVALVARGVVG